MTVHPFPARPSAMEPQNAARAGTTGARALSPPRITRAPRIGLHPDFPAFYREQMAAAHDRHAREQAAFEARMISLPAEALPEATAGLVVPVSERFERLASQEDLDHRREVLVEACKTAIAVVLGVAFVPAAWAAPAVYAAMQGMGL